MPISPSNILLGHQQSEFKLVQVPQLIQVTSYQKKNILKLVLVPSFNSLFHKSFIFNSNFANYITFEEAEWCLSNFCGKCLNLKKKFEDFLGCFFGHKCFLSLMVTLILCRACFCAVYLHLWARSRDVLFCKFTLKFVTLFFKSPKLFHLYSSPNSFS